MHFLSHISESSCPMGPSDNFTTDNSEQLYNTNVKKVYRSSNKSTTSDRCLTIMTGVPVLTIWRRHCPILHSKAGMRLTLQKISTYCPLLRYNKVHPDPICYVSKQFRMSPLVMPYCSRYIIWEKHMSAEFAEVSNQPDWDMHQKILEFRTFDSYSGLTLRRAGDTKLGDSCSDMIRMYSLRVYVLSCRMGCCTTVNDFTTLLQLSVWDLIARLHLPMPTKGSCLKLIPSGFSICKVKRMTLITPSKNRFLLFLYYTSAGLHQIKSSNFRSTCKSGKEYWPFLRGARRLNNGY